MKKKSIVLLSLLMACLLVLSGCACEHEWQEADCLNAKVCAKCEEVEGEALGHDWLPATCAAPETCSRCGETQGEALEHTYGYWEDRDSEMAHRCKVCGYEESVPMDREVFLRQNLVGHWDFMASTDGSQAIYASQFRDDYVGAYFSYAEDGTIEIFTSEETFTAQLDFDFFNPKDSDDGFDYYYFYATAEDGSQLYYYVTFDGEEPILTLHLGQYGMVLMMRQLDLVEGLSGLWAGAGEEQVYSFQLNEDRSFTADFGEEVSGTWHLRNPYTSYGYQYVDFSLKYELDGESVVTTHTVSLGAEGQDYTDTLRYSSVYMDVNEERVDFAKTDDKGLAELENAFENAVKMILGQWTSTSVYTYDSSTSSSSTTPNDTFTITFQEDGTFTAELDQARAGTWELDEVRASGGSSAYISYNLKFEGVSDTVYASLSDGELRFSSHSNNVSRSVYFAQMTEEQKAELAAEMEKAKTAILGDWTSYRIYQESNTISDTSYTVSFNADGTFTTNLDEGSAGTWVFEEVDINTEYNYTSYRYGLEMDGYEGYVSASIHDEDLSISLYLNSQGRNITFAQLSAEDLALIKEAPGMLVGTWTSSEVCFFNEETDQYEPLRKESHQITVNADGTFTATLPEMLDGTWSFYSIDQYGINYSFHSASDSGSIYRINSEDKLNVWINEGEEYYNIFMEKQ